MNKQICITSVALLVVILTGCVTPTQTSPTPPPTQTPFSVLGNIRPGDKIGEMTIERNRSMDYYRPFDASDFDWTIIEPHSQTVERTLPELSVAGVNVGWSAFKTKIESNWEAMSCELYIDDYQIALDQFGWEDINVFDQTGTEEPTALGVSSLRTSPLAGTRFVIRFLRRHPLMMVGTLTPQVNMNTSSILKYATKQLFTLSGDERFVSTR